MPALARGEKVGNARRCSKGRYIQGLSGSGAVLSVVQQCDQRGSSGGLPACRWRTRAGRKGRISHW
ncbi:hypothetical protein FHY18_002712 [Xanthomonas arboricola]|nr:hypothetical protein [Xanthomonas sp. 3793]